MPVQPILKNNESVLRQKTEVVRKFDNRLKDLIQDLVDTLRSTEHGVGLAAPQIGVSMAVAVIEIDEELTILINPKILESEGKYQPSEACLSIPGFHGFPTRALKVTVVSNDVNGKEYQISADGFFAKALQHEIDHLNGLLYVDRLESPDLFRINEDRLPSSAVDRAVARTLRNQPPGRKSK